MKRNEKVLPIVAAKLDLLPEVQAPANPRNDLEWLLSDRQVEDTVRAYLKEQLARRSRLEFGLQDNVFDTSGLDSQDAE